MGCHASSTKHVAPLAIADIAATTQAIADPNTKDDKQDPSVSPSSPAITSPVAASVGIDIDPAQTTGSNNLTQDIDKDRKPVGLTQSAVAINSHEIKVVPLKSKSAYLYSPSHDAIIQAEHIKASKVISHSALSKKFPSLKNLPVSKSIERKDEIVPAITVTKDEKEESVASNNIVNDNKSTHSDVDVPRVPSGSILAIKADDKMPGSLNELVQRTGSQSQVESHSDQTNISASSQVQLDMKVPLITLSNSNITTRSEDPVVVAVDISSESINESEVNCEFDFSVPREEDFYGLKALLKQYLPKLADTSELADKIIKHSSATILRVDEMLDPYGFIVCLDWKKCGGIKDLINCHIESFGLTSLGLIISERLINMPPQLAPKLFGLLKEDLKEKFENLLYISKIYSAEGLYYQAEDEFIEPFATSIIDFEIESKAINDSVVDQKRRIMVLPFSCLGKLVKRLDEMVI